MTTGNKSAGGGGEGGGEESDECSDESKESQEMKEGHDDAGTFRG
jgi:hypothetical protein